MRLQSLLTIFGLALVEVIANPQLQTPLAFASSGPYTKFPSIRRVAVIGAGPSGLQSAATLLEHGFEVRLFERRPKPGAAFPSVASHFSSPPIITDGTHLRSLHWTGHYINDPTLAFTNVRPWTLGRYQSLGFAKTWSGKARLPSQEQMWAEYPGAKSSVTSHAFGSLAEEAQNRQWVAWLNNASLEFGGRLVSPWPIELRTLFSTRAIAYREAFVYYANTAWEAGYTTSRNFTEYENTPRDQWRAETIARIALADEGACDWEWGCEEDW
ncbi:hypothetical protein BS47DRAFT_1486839 [Hydnum rufescens UP504]|uniref:FAD/NAD(P)-binding domain-containing protein n=1 Tax=Hydnum rufescens UP504 TaxID=1448309 RepID=A0A9P6DQT2_9AGAM|nr:hypothetical protein BS47DRAFT_1486839 [Hydnum rufescens UP504]